MKLGVYCIHDKKAQLFKGPFTCLNEALAQRQFAIAVNTGNSELNQFPEDFDLYCLADFNDEDGRFNNREVPELIVNGLSVLMQPETAQPTLEVVNNGQKPPQ